MTAESHPADTEDIAEHARRVTRAEEQVVRSARIVYTLRQQVAQLQDDLGKLNLRSADDNKKVFEVIVRINFSTSFRRLAIVQTVLIIGA